MKKRVLLLFCVLSCVMMMTAGCSLVRGNENFQEAELEAQMDTFLNSWFTADFEGMIASYQSQMNETTLALYQDYAQQQKTYQGIEQKLKTEFTVTADSATVTETILCKSGDKILVSLTFDENGNIQTDENGNYTLKFDAYKTLGQKMGRAGLNTVMSMAVVFCVLIFISLIISCFRFLRRFSDNAEEEPVARADMRRSAPAPVAARAEEPDAHTQVGEDVTDDLELVAVIAAAIMAASETECTDGLVIRSIIRR